MAAGRRPAHLSAAGGPDHDADRQRAAEGVVSLVYFFKPALSPILAWMVHGEEIPGNMLAGILLILAGSFANIIPGILEIRRAKQQMPSN